MLFATCKQDGICLVTIINCIFCHLLKFENFKDAFVLDILKKLHGVC